MILKREEVAGEVMAAEPHPSLAEDCEKTKKGEKRIFPHYAPVSTNSFSINSFSMQHGDMVW